MKPLVPKFPWDDSFITILTHISRKIQRGLCKMSILWFRMAKRTHGKLNRNNYDDVGYDKGSESHFYGDKAYPNLNILITRNDGQTAIMYYLFACFPLACRFVSGAGIEHNQFMPNITYKQTERRKRLSVFFSVRLLIIFSSFLYFRHFRELCPDQSVACVKHVCIGLLGRKRLE